MKNKTTKQEKKIRLDNMPIRQLQKVARKESTGQFFKQVNQNITSEHIPLAKP